MAHCLRRANATHMVNKEWDGIVLGIMGCPFTPVFDGVFFPESPAKALAKENFKKTKIKSNQKKTQQPLQGIFNQIWRSLIKLFKVYLWKAD